MIPIGPSVTATDTVVSRVASEAKIVMSILPKHGDESNDVQMSSILTSPPDLQR